MSDTSHSHLPGDDLLQCSLQPQPVRYFDPSVAAERQETIIITAKYWANGTKLKYYFFDDARASSFPDEIDLVRQGFAAWKELGIGIDFTETLDADEAHVRIGFTRGIGSWSYIGRDCLQIPHYKTTMNFGWDLRHDPRKVGVAIHEIGHAIGMPHEHQNPQAGIVWNTEAVIAKFSGPPNSWDEPTIRRNILDQLPQADIRGSEWDANSIMEYEFPPGLVAAPDEYRINGIRPPGDQLSPLDREWTRRFYPPLDDTDLAHLQLNASVPVNIANGEEISFLFRPSVTQDYELRIFGQCDAVIVLFEERAGGQQFVVGKDDSGKDENAYIRQRLEAGTRYRVNIRMLYRERETIVSLMLW